MNIKEINSKKLFKEFEIQIPYKDIDDSINDKINELIPTVSLPGFRKGKAPLNIVKKKYENNVLSEVIEKIVEQNTKKLIDEKKLKPFRQPKVELKKYEKNQPVAISIKIDLEPQIEVCSFDEIELVNRTIDIDKKRIDENYNQFINSQKHYHKVKDSRAAKISDKIIANITTKDESVPEFLKTQNNMPIITDSDYQILPDIGPILVNKKVKVGDKINLKFDLKEALKQKEKKEVEFTIEIVSLEHLHEFKITKEFLEKNNLKDEKELKDNFNQVELEPIINNLRVANELLGDTDPDGTIKAENERRIADLQKISVEGKAAAAAVLEVLGTKTVPEGTDELLQSLNGDITQFGESLTKLKEKVSTPFDKTCGLLCLDTYLHPVITERTPAKDHPIVL